MFPPVEARYKENRLTVDYAGNQVAGSAAQRGERIARP